jgi:hypothetical protein
MPITEMHVCECEDCQQPVEHPNRALHPPMNVLVSRLDEPPRRGYVALASNRLGHGGAALLAQITGLDEKTLRRGRQEWDAGLGDRPAGRIRLPGGGRPLTEKKTLP